MNMADKYFVDTNILLYAHDTSWGLRHDRARSLVEQIWDSGTGVLSTQVLQELCINLRRKIVRRLPVEEVRQLVQDYMRWEIVINTSESVLHALEIEVRYKTSFGDALNTASGGAALLCRSSLFRRFGCGAKV